MNKTILLQLSKSSILANIKSETFLTGQIDKSVDEKAIALAYHEQAGNEAYQERLLYRGMETNLEELKTYLSDYLSSSGVSVADNITSLEDGDIIKITLVVSDRFNAGYTNSLAKLCSKYVEEASIMDWWKPVNKERVSLYAQFVERDLAAIKRCFNKTAPVAPSYQYTTILNTVGNTIDIGVGEEYTVTYEISAGAIDDIEIIIGDRCICEAGRTEEGFTIIGKQLGHTFVKMYSRHDERVSKTIEVYVTDQS